MLDLAAITAEGNPDPFVVKIADRLVTFTSPEDLDYRHLLSLLEDQSRFFELAIADADERAHVDSTTITSRQVKVLVGEYVKHYGLVTPGEADASSQR